MQGFKARIKENDEKCYEDEDVRIFINPSELKNMDIEVPQIGELLDIVYVKTFYQKGGVKASQKMHLLKYAQKKELELDCEEYVNMFRTSVARISMCAFLPTNIDAVESALFKKIQMECSKNAKKYFSLSELDNIRPNDILKTPR